MSSILPSVLLKNFIFNINEAWYSDKVCTQILISQLFIRINMVLGCLPSKIIIRNIFAVSLFYVIILEISLKIFCEYELII